MFELCAAYIPVLLMVFCTTYVFIVNGAYINRPIFSIFIFAEVSFACLLTKSTHFILVRRLSTRDFFYIKQNKKNLLIAFLLLCAALTRLSSAATRHSLNGIVIDLLPSYILSLYSTHRMHYLFHSSCA